MEPSSEQEEITKRNNPKPSKTDVNDALIKKIYDTLFEQNKTNTDLLYKLRGQRAQTQIEKKFSTDKEEVPETGNDSTVSIEKLQTLFTDLQGVNADLKAETLREEPQRDSGFESARSSAASLGRNSQLEERRNSQLEDRRNSQLEDRRNSQHVDGNSQLEDRRNSQLEDRRNSQHVDGNSQLEDRRNSQLEDRRNSKQEDGLSRRKEILGQPRPVSEAMAIRQGDASRKTRFGRSRTFDNNDHPDEAITQVGEISASGGATMDQVSKRSDMPVPQPLETENTGPTSINLDCPTKHLNKTALPETPLGNAGTSTGTEVGRSISSNSEPVENLDQSPSDSENSDEDN